MAAIWAVHPLTTNAVAYVTQRMEMLWSLFFVLGVWFFLNFLSRCQTCQPFSRRRGRALFWLVASIVSFWLGMRSKEPIVLSIACLPLIDWVLNGRKRIFEDETPCTSAAWWQRNWRWWYYVALLAPVVIAIPVFVFPALLNSSKTSSGGFFVQSITPWEYWLTQPEVLLTYLARWATWLPGNFDYLWPPQHNTAVLLLEWLLLITVVTITVRGLYHRSIWSLPVACFLVNVSTTSLVPLIDLLVEYRVYAASVWLTLLFVMAVAVLVDHVSRVIGSERQTLGARLGLAALGLLVIGYLTAQCRHRSSVFASTRHVWQDAVDQAPWNYRAHVNLANELVEEGEAERAVEHCQIALGLESARRQPPHQQAKVHAALALAASAAGQTSLALESIDRAIKLTPGGSENWLRAAQIHADTRQWDEALTAIDQAIQNRPDRKELLTKRVTLLAAAGRWEEAQDQLQGVLRDDSLPDSVAAEAGILSAQLMWMRGEAVAAKRRFATVTSDEQRDTALRQLAAWLRRDQRFDEAAEVINLLVDPESSIEPMVAHFEQLVVEEKLAEALHVARQLEASAGNEQSGLPWRVQRAILLQRLGQIDASQRLIKELAERYPAEPAVWIGSGDIARRLQDWDRAIADYQRAAELGTRDSEVFNNLGILLTRQRPDLAETYLRRAVKISPDNHQAWHSLGNALLKQNKLRSAIACYQAALKRQPDFQPSLQTLQLIQQQLGTK